MSGRRIYFLNLNQIFNNKEIFSESKPNLDCDYTISDRFGTENGIPFDAESVGKM